MWHTFFYIFCAEGFVVVYLVGPSSLSRRLAAILSYLLAPLSRSRSFWPVAHPSLPHSIKCGQPNFCVLQRFRTFSVVIWKWRCGYGQGGTGQTGSCAKFKTEVNCQTVSNGRRKWQLHAASAAPCWFPFFIVFLFLLAMIFLSFLFYWVIGAFICHTPHARFMPAMCQWPCG